jgi:hypothetical protein
MMESQAVPVEAVPNGIGSRLDTKTLDRSGFPEDPVDEVRSAALLKQFFQVPKVFPFM